MRETIIKVNDNYIDLDHVNSITKIEHEGSYTGVKFYFTVKSKGTDITIDSKYIHKSHNNGTDYDIKREEEKLRFENFRNSIVSQWLKINNQEKVFNFEYK